MRRRDLPILLLAALSSMAASSTVFSFPSHGRHDTFLGQFPRVLSNYPAISGKSVLEAKISTDMPSEKSSMTFCKQIISDVNLNVSTVVQMPDGATQLDGPMMPFGLMRDLIIEAPGCRLGTVALLGVIKVSLSASPSRLAKHQSCKL